MNALLENDVMWLVKSILNSNHISSAVGYWFWRHGFPSSPAKRDFLGNQTKFWKRWEWELKRELETLPKSAIVSAAQLAELVISSWDSGFESFQPWSPWKIMTFVKRYHAMSIINHIIASVSVALIWKPVWLSVQRDVCASNNLLGNPNGILKMMSCEL